MSGGKKLITDPAELRLTVDVPRTEVTVLGPDDPAAKKIGWSCYEVVPGSPEAEAWDMELQPHRWTETDEANRYKGDGVSTKPPDRWGSTDIPVLEFLTGRPWNNAALNVVHGLRPSSIRVVPPGQGVWTNSSLWRVTVHIDATGVIRSIHQEMQVGLIGCRYGADVSAYIEGRTPPTKTPSAIFNPRALKNLIGDPTDGKDGR
jgi:hypothetical protein